MSSLSTVLVQEVDRFNRLLEQVKRTLIELRRAIKGEVVMSGELEKMFDAFLYQRTPDLWAKVRFVLWCILYSKVRGVGIRS